MRLRTAWATAPLLAALAATLVACGTTTTPVGDPGGVAAPPEAPYLTDADGEVLVSCGTGDGWPPSVMSAGVPGVLDDDEATRIFRGILDDPRTGPEARLSLLPDGVDVEWRVLSATERSVTLGLGRWTGQGPGTGAQVLTVEDEGGTWRAVGWGDCQVSPVLKPGHAAIDLTAYRGTAESRRLTVTLNERECTSARDPGPYLHEPLVVETAESVTVWWTSEPAVGGQTCPGNPSVEKPVELAEPLGTRPVLDGLSHPPRQVPPSPLEGSEPR